MFSRHSLYVNFFFSYTHQLNKAARELMNGDSSPSSPSGSDEENESNRKRRGRRGSRPKNIAALTSSSANNATSAECTCLGQGEAVIGTSNDPISKRHTIHVENPNEQQRQSRRALNLSDDFEPQVRTRAMSQGRRALDNHQHHTVSL